MLITSTQKYGCSYTQTGKSVFLAFFPFIFPFVISGVTRLSASNVMHIPDMVEL